VINSTALSSANNHQGQEHLQQQQVSASEFTGSEYTASAAAGGGLFLTPRSTEVFAAELQGQLYSKVEQEVQQRLAQVRAAAAAAAADVGLPTMHSRLTFWWHTMQTLAFDVWACLSSKAPFCCH
jgi:hypothetical protein